MDIKSDNQVNGGDDYKQCRFNYFGELSRLFSITVILIIPIVFLVVIRINVTYRITPSKLMLKKS